jgi:autotransporter-associated beta strand protein
MTDATWKKHPTDHDFENAANWTPASVPGSTDTAFFGPSKITSLTFSLNNGTVGGWTFKANASDYRFALAQGKVFRFDGAGIVIHGGGVKITNNGQIDFKNASTAGHAHIINNLFFSFNDDSTADHASIVANAEMDFYDTSKAGHAKITNNSYIPFVNDSSADHAVIVTTSNGYMRFYNHSDGGSARFITKAGGGVNFSDGTGPGGANVHHAGSIAGAGDYVLGAGTLEVGSNNRSTTVSGLIEEGVGAGGLVKVGTGTLKLSHANNTYSFGTVLSAGTLDIAAQGASGTAPSIDFDTLSTAKQILMIDNAALANHAFGPAIASFGIGDVIDLRGLKFTAHAKATFNGTDTLTVKSGHVTDTLTLQNPDVGIFKAKDDGHGGTKVILKAAMAKPLADAATLDTHASPHQSEHHTGRDSFQFHNLAALGGISHERLEIHNGRDSQALVVNDQHDALGFALHLDFAGGIHGGADGHFLASTAPDSFVI